MLFPPILVSFNIIIGLYIAFSGQIEAKDRIYVVMVTLIIVIYILLISIFNRVYFHNDTTIPCGRIIVFGVICGVVIDSFMVYVLGENCFTFYPWCCLVVTVAEIVLNELLLKKISLYRVYRASNELVFFVLNIIFMCIYVTIYVGLIQFGYVEKYFWIIYVGLTIQTIFLICEFVTNNINECRPYQKEICKKDGKEVIVNSGIEERRTEKIVWYEDNREIELKKNQIIKISYTAHYSHKGMKKRKIILDDGNEVNGYKFKCYSGWYGICWKEGESVKVELYPDEKVVRCEDNIKAEKDDTSI